MDSQRNSASAPLKPLENRMPTFSNTPRKRKRSLSPTQDAAARSKLARTALRPAATPLPTRVPLPPLLKPRTKLQLAPKSTALISFKGTRNPFEPIQTIPSAPIPPRKRAVVRTEEVVVPTPPVLLAGSFGASHGRTICLRPLPPADVTHLAPLPLRSAALKPMPVFSAVVPKDGWPLTFLARTKGSPALPLQPPTMSPALTHHIDRVLPPGPQTNLKAAQTGALPHAAASRPLLSILKPVQAQILTRPGFKSGPQAQVSTSGTSTSRPAFVGPNNSTSHLGTLHVGVVQPLPTVPGSSKAQSTRSEMVAPLGKGADPLVDVALVDETEVSTSTQGLSTKPPFGVRNGALQSASDPHASILSGIFSSSFPSPRRNTANVPVEDSNSNLQHTCPPHPTVRPSAGLSAPTTPPQSNVPQGIKDMDVAQESSNMQATRRHNDAVLTVLSEVDREVSKSDSIEQSSENPFLGDLDWDLPANTTYASDSSSSSSFRFIIPPARKNIKRGKKIPKKSALLLPDVSTVLQTKVPKSRRPFLSNITGLLSPSPSAHASSSPVPSPPTNQAKSYAPSDLPVARLTPTSVPAEPLTPVSNFSPTPLSNHVSMNVIEEPDASVNGLRLELGEGRLANDVEFDRGDARRSKRVRSQSTSSLSSLPPSPLLPAKDIDLNSMFDGDLSDDEDEATVVESNRLNLAVELELDRVWRAETRTLVPLGAPAAIVGKRLREQLAAIQVGVGSPAIGRLQRRREGGGTEGCIPRTIVKDRPIPAEELRVVTFNAQRFLGFRGLTRV